MKRLVSSSEAAKILGLSLQGIHYRIKKGQLSSIKQDGKTFVYIDSAIEQNSSEQNDQKKDPQHNSAKPIEYEKKILKAKDQQIELLKKTIKFMKKQYTTEIDRLERNQTQILNVFQSEVDLLKSAFNEMRAIYKQEHKPLENKINKVDRQNKQTMEFMDLKEFFRFMRIHNKTDSQIKSIILDKVKSGDKRFIYNKNTKEVLIYKSDFLDLI